MDSSRLKITFPALSLALLILAGEYLARRIVIDWFPAIGTWRVNDMLLSALVYACLVWFTIPVYQRDSKVLFRTLKEIFSAMRRQPVLVSAALAVGSGWLVILDRNLWVNVSVPYLSSPWSTDLQVLGTAAVPLTAASLLLVNGMFVPLAEERLWRGLIQPRLASGMGKIAGLLICALLFSVKHVLVDASMGRFLMLTVFGLVMGFTAARYGWRAAAAAHILANLAATILALVFSGGVI